MSTGRIESFSDGVIAVTITLLVLNISVPKSSAHHTLTHELLRQWPIYAAYITSFNMLGVDLSHERRRDLVVRGLTGVLPYALATGIAYVSPFATLAICAAIAIFYATPLATGGPPSQP